MLKQTSRMRKIETRNDMKKRDTKKYIWTAFYYHISIIFYKETSQYNRILNFCCKFLRLLLFASQMKKKYIVNDKKNKITTDEVYFFFKLRKTI